MGAFFLLGIEAVLIRLHARHPCHVVGCDEHVEPVVVQKPAVPLVAAGPVPGHGGRTYGSPSRFEPCSRIAVSGRWSEIAEKRTSPSSPGWGTRTSTDLTAGDTYT